PPVKSG
ncbi:hypothetical protein D030_2495, partial [Vibrio parahaemolyticus AQ3810]